MESNFSASRVHSILGCTWSASSPISPMTLLHLLSEDSILPLEVPASCYVIYPMPDFFKREGLENVIVGAASKCLNGGIQRPVCGHNQNTCL